ncbi:hypothetical protein M885DRAFT_623870, partial [Pelagophyceae sp. CCMP2097]
RSATPRGRELGACPARLDEGHAAGFGAGGAHPRGARALQQRASRVPGASAATARGRGAGFEEESKKRKRCGRGAATRVRGEARPTTRPQATRRETAGARGATRRLSSEADEAARRRRRRRRQDTRLRLGRLARGLCVFNVRLSSR